MFVLVYLAEKVVARANVEAKTFVLFSIRVLFSFTLISLSVLL